jgi:hypothetical protein
MISDEDAYERFLPATRVQFGLGAVLQYSNTPPLRHSATPPLHHSITPPLRVPEFEDDDEDGAPGEWVRSSHPPIPV